jgi:predicted Zn-dependent peptidase
MGAKPLEIHPAELSDLKSALAWYLDRSESAAAKFVDEVDRISKPHVHTNDELATDLAAQILERLESKGSKDYTIETVLIINCIPNHLILPSEWNDAIERVTKAQVHLAFREVFLVEMVMSYSTMLYGDRK